MESTFIYLKSIWRTVAGDLSWGLLTCLPICALLFACERSYLKSILRTVAGDLGWGFLTCLPICLLLFVYDGWFHDFGKAYFIVALLHGQLIVIRSQYELAGFIGIAAAFFTATSQTLLLLFYWPRPAWHDERIRICEVIPVFAVCVFITKLIEAYANASIGAWCQKVLDASERSDQEQVNNLMDELRESTESPEINLITCRTVRMPSDISSIVLRSQDTPRSEELSTAAKEELRKQVLRTKWSTRCQCVPGPGGRALCIILRGFATSIWNALLAVLGCAVFMYFPRIVQWSLTTQTWERHQFVLTALPLTIGFVLKVAFKSHPYLDRAEMHYSSAAAICAFQYSVIYSARTAKDMIFPLIGQMLGEVIRRSLESLNSEMEDANRTWWSKLGQVIEKRLGSTGACCLCLEDHSGVGSASDDAAADPSTPMVQPARPRATPQTPQTPSDDAAPDPQTSNQNKNHLGQSVRLMSTAEYTALISTWFMMLITPKSSEVTNTGVGFASSMSTMFDNMDLLGFEKLFLALAFEILCDGISLLVENVFGLRPQDANLKDAFLQKSYDQTRLGLLAHPLRVLSLFHAPVCALLAWRWSKCILNSDTPVLS